MKGKFWKKDSLTLTNHLPKIFAVRKPTIMRNETNTISPIPGISVGKYELGLYLSGINGVINPSNIFIKEITIQNVMTIGAVTSIPVKK